MRPVVKRLSILLSVCTLCLLTFLAATPVRGNDGFTEEEITYMKEHPTITIGVDPEFIPYEFIDLDGKYKGIAADYLKLIEVKTGLTFEPVSDKSWFEVYEMAQEGDIDMLACVGLEESRMNDFLFTDPYFRFQRALVSADSTEEKDFDHLTNYQIGVQRNSSHYEFLRTIPGVEISTYKDQEALLTALSLGDVDAAVMNYASARFNIQQYGITNLRIDDIYTDSYTDLSMAVTLDNPTLQSILNKSLKLITEEEKTAIRTKWLDVEMKLSYAVIIRNALIASTVVLIILGAILYWNRILKREINRRILLEQELIEAKKEADSANEAKSVFLAHMSHEIRTPMNAITGLTYLLENTTTSSIQDKYLRMLKDSSHNLLAIINDILDFSKIESGEMTFESVAFNMDDLIKKIGNMFMVKANEKGVALYLKKDTQLSNDMVGDPAKIEQVLINLLSNAVKFTDKGSIVLSVGFGNPEDFQLNTGLDDTVFVAFEVTDTGMGISDKQLGELFQPFHQLNSSITRTHGGTGLGLSICKEIIDRLGGAVKVTSTLGEGSTFRFILPLSARQESGTSYVNYPELKELNILVIDPDNTDRTIVADYLRSFGPHVFEAADRKTALTYSDSEIDLVITEINLTGSNALDLVEIWPDKQTRFMITAKQIHEQQYQDAESLGIQYIMMKPIVSSLLFDAIVQSFFLSPSRKSEASSTKTVSKDLLRLRRVLLVEDNPVNQIIEKEILENNGFMVKLASNGLEAVQWMDKDPYVDIVVMDIHMPVMDGYEASRKIRALNDTVPIVAMTAVSFEDISEKCAESGMTGYIMKPINPSTLMDELEKQLQSSDDNDEKHSPIAEKVSATDENLLNTDLGLHRLNNNKATYIKVLKAFESELIPNQQEISKALQNKENQLAYEALHRLKGVAGNVGCVSLYQATTLLMTTLNDPVEMDLGPYIYDFERIVQATHEKLLAVIRQYEEEVPAPQVESLGTMDSAKLDQLLMLLDRSDLGAIKLYDEIKASLSEDIRHQTDEHMANLSFDKVRELLTQ